MLLQYDPKLVVVTFGGFLISGWPDGEFLNVTMDNDLYSKEVGADGQTTRVRVNDSNATATLTLSQSSKSNEVLSGIALTDKLANAGVHSFMVKDLLGSSLLATSSAWIKKEPDTIYAREISARAWTLDLADLNLFVGGNPAVEIVQ